MVAAEHERDRVLCNRSPDERGYPRTGLENLRQIANALVHDRRRLGLSRLHVAVVVDRVTERAEPLFEAGVPNRRRPHVDPPAALAQIQGSLR